VSEGAIADIPNYRELDARISTSGQPSERQFEVIAEAGFEVVINLGLHDDPRYALPDEAGVVGSQGMDYIHIPVWLEAPAEAELLDFFTAMESHAHQKILVHCAASKRATILLGLFRVIRQGWPAEAAFAPLRSVWEPDAIWSNFITAMLAKYHQDIS
jgi:protein tyrosine phosphatase (PTP) superfamily phosphohydrolase (DUF442 family)